jgi:hypothetical protein
MARLNCRTAIVNNVAVGSRAGTVELRVDRDAVMASTIPWERAVSSRTLQLVTLDDYVRDRGIDRVAVLKIDTEGMELDVLDGAVATLAITGVVAMETHGEDRHEGTLDRLRSAGLGIDHQEFDGRTGMVFASTRAPVGGTAGTDAVSGARSWQQAD